MKSKRLSCRELILISRQLYYLIKLSLPLTESLKQLEKTCKDIRLREILKKVYLDIEQGKSLAQSFHPYTPELFSSLLAFGERHNQLPTALKEISAHYEAQDFLEQEIKANLFYPYAVMGGTFILGIFFFFFWSQLACFFLELHLPLWLKTFYNLMSKLSDPRFFIIALIILLLSILFLWRKGLLFKIPLYLLFLSPYIKGIYTKACLVKIYRVLSLLLSLNYPLPQAIASTKKLITHPLLLAEFIKLEEKISSGKSLQNALDESKWLKSPFFKEAPDFQVFSQDPVKTLSWTANYLENEIFNTSQSILALLEPLCLSVVGVVLLLVISLFWLPIYTTIANIPFP